MTHCQIRNAFPHSVLRLNGYPLQQESLTSLSGLHIGSMEVKCGEIGAARAHKEFENVLLLC
jgi:hypothetical protein